MARTKAEATLALGKLLGRGSASPGDDHSTIGTGAGYQSEDGGKDDSHIQEPS
jgi:hypothetical protein